MKCIMSFPWWLNFDQISITTYNSQVLCLDNIFRRKRRGREGEEGKDWYVFLSNIPNIERICFVKIVKEFIFYFSFLPSSLPSPIGIQMREMQSLYFPSHSFSLHFLLSYHIINGNVLEWTFEENEIIEGEQAWPWICQELLLPKNYTNFLLPFSPFNTNNQTGH